MLFLLLVAQLASAELERRVSGGYDFVDPLIGTINGGHVFPGATLPFGMAKAGPDVLGDNEGGFADDGSPVYGFSHMHDSGTGGSPSLGNFPIFPYVNCPNDDVNQCNFDKNGRAQKYINSSVQARPGYFSITLENQIKTEMTVSEHAALYRFTFPQGTTSPLVLLDLTDLPSTISGGSASVDTKTGRITAQGSFRPSFGIGSYKSYVCVDFKGGKLRDAAVHSPGAYSRFSLNGTQISARVGVSLISTAKACSNAQKEIPSFSFSGVLGLAETAWRNKLSAISIDAGSVSKSLQTVFYSGIYRAMISPQDYTGENPLWNSSEPYYDSYYCIWDSFRSIHPLLTLVDPNSQTLMIRSLIDIYRHEGKLPDCRMSLCKGLTQGGSNADIVLADAYVKGLKHGIDWNTGYQAVVSDAEVEPSNWGVEGRGSLASWKSVNFVPTDDSDHNGIGPFTRSISRTVEYAYDDFCISEMAKGLGHSADQQKYLKRSGNWKNMYKADQTSTINGADTGFKGFLQPRYHNMSWGYQDPILCSPLQNPGGCYLNPGGHETYEGSCWLYTFFVPGDMASLVKTLGGPQSFVKRLDYLHESGLLYVGDEQAFLTVFQYHYAGRPGRSAYRAHSYIPKLFNDTIGGIPGNDDSGAMGSFAGLAMMGLFPNPGQNVYLITPPFFPSVSIKNGETGKTATIKNVNFDASYKNIYIQSAKLNGKAYTKNWITHDFFATGGTLELTLGPKESSWGTHAADLPPSSST